MAKREPVYVSSTRTTERPCPVCHARLDGVTCLSLDRRPGPVHMQFGDVTKCGYCGAFLKLMEFGFVVADPVDLDRHAPVLQRIVHDIPTLPEIKGGRKKRPS